MQFLRAQLKMMPGIVADVKKNGLEIVTLTIGPVEACCNQIVKPLLSSGVGQGLGNLS